MNGVTAARATTFTSAPSRPAEQGTAGTSFGAVLGRYLEEVNQLQLDAEAKTRQFLAGQDIELHQVILATEKAALALELTQTLRNKVIEAYQEIMRMQV
ncbi:MAG: flagellar hook-basal body complex protein FliE [Bacillota bacterium]|nr:flagellar hook-basal body complex protein FliE [Bacillota bacterium]MDK2925052.1 flagellar hook-basal body complex protein FliE [Bacillota bacterium]